MSVTVFFVLGLALGFYVIPYLLGRMEIGRMTGGGDAT